MIRAGSGLSTHEDPASAGREAAREAVSELSRPSVAFVFSSGLDQEELGHALEGAREALRGAVPVGCSGGGVIGTGQEVEGDAAVSVLAVEADEDAALLHPFHAPLTGDGPRDAETLAARLAGKSRGALERAVLLLFADPLAFDARPLLGRLRDKLGKLPVAGGLAAAAGSGPGIPAFAGHELGVHAASGVLLSGTRARVTLAVAQGTKALGVSGRATRTDANLIHEIDGAPALEKVKLALEAAREGGGTLFCGLGQGQLGASPGDDDYLARNILGVDRKSGAVAVAEVVPTGSWISFLVRDAAASRADLDARVRELKAAYAGSSPAFGLYFSCVGRGAGLYGEPGVDVSIIREHLGDFPLAGFFGNGELAPFLGTNFLHNYTGVLVLVGSA